MDSDRKSTVSSFYGRKNSSDALNTDFPSPMTPNFGGQPRTRDDASSFFNPDRASRNMDAMAHERPSAGYNRNSFFHTGREEPLKGGRDEEEGTTPGAADAWDVYADFNNAGPRYSTAFGNETGYQPIDPSASPVPKAEDAASSTGAGGTEIVTVPALGPEWAKSEMRDMTKAGRKEKKRETRQQKWRAWHRGERGLCGGCLTRKVLAFVMFAIVAAIVIAIAICLPRVPSFSFNGEHPLLSATGSWGDAIPRAFSRSPANFSFPAFADLQLNTQETFVPINFKHLRAEIFDTETSRRVAVGDLPGITVPAKAFPSIQLPLNFTYFATNETDQTWKTWYDACKNKMRFPDQTRPGLNFRLVLSLDIAGLVGTRHVSTQVNNANCPMELPINSI